MASKTKGNKRRTFKKGSRATRSNKKSKAKKIVDIGTTRPRILGSVGMTQNVAVSSTLAKTMAQNRNMAQGLAQSQALGMGQSLA
jgi:hypothetical protein